MTTWQRIFVCAGVALMLWATWMFRYDMRTVTAGDRAGVGYVLDRWTGSVYLVTAGFRRELKDEKPTFINLEEKTR